MTCAVGLQPHSNSRRRFYIPRAVPPGHAADYLFLLSGVIGAVSKVSSLDSNYTPHYSTFKVRKCQLYLRVVSIRLKVSGQSDRLNNQQKIPITRMIYLWQATKTMRKPAEW